jgi:hypothetical protein
MITRWGACYLGELKDEMVYPISGFDNQCRLAKLDFLVGQIRCKKLATQELDITIYLNRLSGKRIPARPTILGMAFGDWTFDKDYAETTN